MEKVINPRTEIFETSER